MAEATSTLVRSGARLATPAIDGRMTSGTADTSAIRLSDLPLRQAKARLTERFQNRYERGRE